MLPQRKKNGTGEILQVLFRGRLYVLRKFSSMSAGGTPICASITVNLLFSDDFVRTALKMIVTGKFIEIYKERTACSANIHNIQVKRWSTENNV